jgi:hypothetical protein
MTIYEYVLEDAGAGFTCPPWIDDGGYWLDGENMIGVRDDDNTSAVPEGAISFTSAELVTRQLALHAVTPMMVHNEDPTVTPIAMTDAEVSTMIQDWVTTKQG